MIRPVVLAGGSGTRLWPLSRQNHPKQFLPLFGERSLFQESLLRVVGMDGASVPVVVCNEAHRFLVLRQMRELQTNAASVIVEPAVRSTAPALTLAALRLLDTEPESSADAVMLVMPADHLVTDTDSFRTAVERGLPLAAGGDVVTFGVVPSAPETGFGYIRKGRPVPRDGTTASAPYGPVAHHVAEFVEKPDLETAMGYLDGGAHLWNSGIFMIRPSVWLSELEWFRPDISRACRAAVSGGSVDGEFFRPAAEFSECPAESIDYAVMEKGPQHATTGAEASQSACSGYSVVTLDAGWSDVGSWSAMWEKGEHDPDGNVVQGDVYAESTKDSLLVARHRLLATVGLRDVVVVETPDALLIAGKDRVQDVRRIVHRLKADGRPEQESHRRVHRPWGSYEVVDEGEGFQVKRLIVDPGATLSLQKHRHRAEHWVVVKGTARVTIGDERFMLSQNESTYVPQEATHRLENPGDVPLEIVEVQTGDYLGEDDIVRLEDDYGRVEQP